MNKIRRAAASLTTRLVESVFCEALFDAFDAKTEPADLTIARVLTEFVPLSKTMAEQISGLTRLSILGEVFDYFREGNLRKPL